MILNGGDGRGANVPNLVRHYSEIISFDEQYQLKIQDLIWSRSAMKNRINCGGSTAVEKVEKAEHESFFTALEGILLIEVWPFFRLDENETPCNVSALWRHPALMKFVMWYNLLDFFLPHLLSWRESFSESWFINCFFLLLFIYLFIGIPARGKHHCIIAESKVVLLSGQPASDFPLYNFILLL